MTADDVKFTFERHVDPKTASPYKNDWEVLDRVDITDKYSGVIVLKEPFAPGRRAHPRRRAGRTGDGALPGAATA